MKKQKRRDHINKLDKNKIKTMFLISISIVILCAPIVSAKYNFLENLKGGAQVAKPIFEVKGIEKSKISALNNIGYYEFCVKNFNEQEVSEIGFVYTIEIISNTDESIKFELYENEKQIELQNLKTENLYIQGNEKIEQKYKLKVIYDNTLGQKEKDILEDVQIKVYSEQEKVGSR